MEPGDRFSQAAGTREQAGEETWRSEEENARKEKDGREEDVLQEVPEIIEEALAKESPLPESSRTLAGRTLQWKFVDGPTAEKVYEHTFHRDGTVVFHEVKAGSKPQPSKEGPKYASFEVAPATHLVSYLSDSGFTLTVAVNLDTRRVYGIASNEKQWFPVTGTLESVK